jgi:hypothetical protein
MKKHLLFIFLILSLGAGAQDTAFMTSGPLTLRLNDWEFVAKILRSDVNCEGIFDSIKVRLRPPTVYPNGTDLVSINTVVNLEAKTLVGNVHRIYDASNRAACERIFTAVKAMNASPTHWLNRAVDQYAADKDTKFSNDKQDGKTIYKR